jgi:hypothetical protein
MPICFALAVASVDRWIRTSALKAVLFGVVAGTLTSVVALEVVRVSAVGVNRYLHAWSVIGLGAAIGDAGLAALLLGGWLLGGTAGLIRYMATRPRSLS